MIEQPTRRDLRATVSARARRARRLRGFMAGLLVFLGVAGGAGLFLYQTYTTLQSKVTTATAADLLDHDNRPTKEVPNPSDPYSGPLNILLIGSDERKSGEGSVQGMRSDTVMVAHISSDRSRAEIVSIPRDSWVEIPSCQLPNGNQTNPTVGKFNAAFSLGGQTGDIGSAVACTIRTVEDLTGLYIDDYVVIDFDGFEGMVDALGGVEFDVPFDIIDPGFSNTYIKEGLQTLDGETALRYARVRKAEGMDGSDISRIDRQQELLDAIIDKAKSKIVDPGAMYGLAEAGLSMITTSNRLGNLQTMGGMGWSVKDAEVSFLTVPIVDRGDGSNVLWTSQADEMWQLLRDDEPVNEDALAPENGLADGEFPDGESADEWSGTLDEGEITAEWGNGATEWGDTEGSTAEESSSTGYGTDGSGSYTSPNTYGQGEDGLSGDTDGQWSDSMNSRY